MIRFFGKTLQPNLAEDNKQTKNVFANIEKKLNKAHPLFSSRHAMTTFFATIRRLETKFIHYSYRLHHFTNENILYNEQKRSRLTKYAKIEFSFRYIITILSVTNFITVSTAK